MTEYLLSVHHAADDIVPEGDAVAALHAAVDAFNSELQDSGAWVFAGGLLPVETSRVVRPTGEVTSGPRATADAHLGGFWVIEVADDDAALEWAHKAVATGVGPIELRPFQGE